MNLTLRQLSYIVRAARTCSISAAAEAEAISPSSILMAIDKFESEFQTQLFVRQPSKGLVITGSGKRVIEHVVRFLDEAEDFESRISNQGPSVDGELRVGVFSSISAHTIPRILRNLAVDHPKLSIRLQEGNLITTQEYLRNGNVDIVLSYDAGMTDEFHIQPLMNVPYHAVLPEGDPLAEKAKVSLKDLTNRPLILLSLPGSEQHILSLFQHHGYRPNVIHRTGSYEMIRTSVAAGLGVAVMNMRPQINVTYGGEEVVCRAISEEIESVRLVLATRCGAPISRRAVVFTKYCNEFITSEFAQSMAVI